MQQSPERQAVWPLVECPNAAAIPLAEEDGRGLVKRGNLRSRFTVSCIERLPVAVFQIWVGWMRQFLPGRGVQTTGHFCSAAFVPPGTPENSPLFQRV